MNQALKQCYPSEKISEHVQSARENKAVIHNMNISYPSCESVVWIAK